MEFRDLSRDEQEPSLTIKLDFGQEIRYISKQKKFKIGCSVTRKNENGPKRKTKNLWVQNSPKTFKDKDKTELEAFLDELEAPIIR